MTPRSPAAGRATWAAATCLAGVGLAAVYWSVFSGPFPLDEFCTRRRPTWVLGLFDTPRYTAVTGPVFLGAYAALTGLYVLALWLARRAEGRLAGLLLVGGPLLFAAVLLPGYPLLSNDIFKYVVDGRILAVYGDNPFIRVPADYPDDRFYDLVYWKAVVNAHGPIWRWLEAASAQAGGERCVNAIVAMKVWPTLAYLGTTAVLYRFLRATRPEWAVVGTVAYAWCPLVLLESVQNGHNDVVAALPTLLAAWAALAGRWRLAFPLLAVGFLVKPLAAAAGPVLLVAAWRLGGTARREALLGIGLAGALVVAAYAPFYRGLETFQGLERGSIFSASPAELLVIQLERSGWPLDQAMAVARTAGVVAFVGLVGLALVALWRGRLDPLGGVAAVFLSYLLVASQWFNPWYLLWLLPFAALVPSPKLRALGFAFAGLAPLTYLLQYDARLVVPVVFLPVAALAVYWRRALGWPAGPRVPAPASLGSPRAVGNG